MGDAKRRQRIDDFIAADKQAQNTQCQRPELFQRYALGIFQKYLLHFKKVDETTPDAIQRMVNTTLNSRVGKELIALCMNDSEPVVIEREAMFGLILDGLVSGRSIEIEIDGDRFNNWRHQQARFKSFEKGIDLEKHKQIARDCLLFLFSKPASQILEYLVAYFLGYAGAVIYEPLMLEEDVNCIIKKYWAAADITLFFEILTIPWAKEFEMIQDDLDDRLKERW